MPFLPLPQAYTKHLSCPISVSAFPIFTADNARSVPIPSVWPQAARETGGSCVTVYICCSLLFTCSLLLWCGSVVVPPGHPCPSVGPLYGSCDVSSCAPLAPRGCHSIVNQSVRGYHVLFRQAEFLGCSQVFKLVSEPTSCEWHVLFHGLFPCRSRLRPLATRTLQHVPKVGLG